jgi:50S ribosomal protein L16 3-hydroxylase
MTRSLAGWLANWRPTKRQIDDYIGRFLTEPKPSVWFEAQARPPALSAWWEGAQRRGVRADRRSRLAYRGRHLFINGECFDMLPGTSASLRRLADSRELPPDALRATPVDSDLARSLHQWFCAGWINHSR